MVFAVLTEVWSTASDPAISAQVLGAAPMGDVNGDGYDDLLVLEYADDGVSGLIRLYFGSSAGVSTMADWIGVTDSLYGTFRAVAAGDINGDGRDDLMIALPYANILFAMLGSPTGFDPTPVWAVDAPAWPSSIATAGDVNADGYDDVLVGATSDADGGFAYLYLGSPTGPSPIASWWVAGDDGFGTVVASAGDVNGDGFDDVAVGTSCDPYPYYGTGRVDVFLGSASGLSPTPDWTTSQAPDSSDLVCTQLGNHVATAGDVNGDGYDDLIVGAPEDSGPGDFYGFYTEQGTASVFHGSAGGLAGTPSWSAMGDQLNGGFGGAVASAGDVDGDGYDDILVGAPDQSSDTRPFDGRAYLYRGGPTGLAAFPMWIDSGDATYASLGAAIGSAGDVNGDDLDDVWVYSGQYEPDGTLGRVILYAGSDDCASGPDTDGDGRVDACDLCVGDDLSHDADGDGWCALGLDGEILDCDETDPDANPDGLEVCDGADSDCADGVPIEETDRDGDGIYPCGGDCDDLDATLHPYADEACDDGLDNNCDGTVDESCSTPTQRQCGCSTPGPTALFALWAVLLIRRRP